MGWLSRGPMSICLRPQLRAKLNLAGMLHQKEEAERGDE